VQFNLTSQSRNRVGTPCALLAREEIACLDLLQLLLEVA